MLKMELKSSSHAAQSTVWFFREIYWNFNRKPQASCHFSYPAQAVVCPIAEENNTYVKKLFEKLFKEGIKCEMDLRNEKINYKVREHSLAKIPYILVCGKKEVLENTVTVRKLGSEKQEVIKREDLIKNMLDLNKMPLI